MSWSRGEWRLLLSAQNACPPKREPCEVCGALAVLMLAPLPAWGVMVCPDCRCAEKTPVPRGPLWLRFLRWLASL